MITLPTELILEIINYLNANDLKHLIFTNKEICGLLYSTETVKFYQKYTTDLINRAVRKSLFIFKTIFYSVKINSTNNLLFSAIIYNNLEVVKFLVKNGADITVNDNYAIRIAGEYDHPEIVKFLIRCGADASACNNDSIFVASAYGYLEVIKILVANGADVTCAQNYPIRIASNNGHLEIVKFLVSCGVDVTADNNKSIRLANDNGHLEVVEFLIKCGATL